MTRHMPPRSPLMMPEQDFRHKAPLAHPAPAGAPVRRFAVFVPTLLGTAAMIWGLHTLFADDGMTWMEYLLLTLIAATFVWVTFALSTIVLGLAARFGHMQTPSATAPIDVALLVPMYNEVPSDVFGNARAMLNDLAHQHGGHRYTLFMLSDTRHEGIAAQEAQAFEVLRRSAPPGIAVYYRRRADNIDRKVGNLTDWVTGWGGAYETMLVLDADSLMSGRAIHRLATEMAADPTAGLIQTCPQLIGAETLFARIQQFSNVAYGWLLAEGLAHWSRTEGNYWGHNAIIRTRAFAASAGLPHLRGLLGGRDLIYSHDFVEAGLLRRAGWRVRFLPRITGSFEEVPGTLIDYVQRDARWCRGNLQHLRVLGARGMHSVSRFHLFQGAAAYLMSPAWLVLLVFWALLGRDAETNVITYFSETNPLFPSWPPEMTHIDSAIFLIVMYAVLLLPKLTCAVIIASQPRAVRRYGGSLTFLRAVLTELLLSVAYAPVLMIQQCKAVLRATFGLAGGWSPQSRTAQDYPLATLLRFHWLETVLGALLCTGLATGFVSWWLLPIAVSLMMAVPLSWLSGKRMPRALQLDNPLTLHEPRIVTRAIRARAAMAAELSAAPLAAE